MKISICSGLHGPKGNEGRFGDALYGSQCLSGPELDAHPNTLGSCRYDRAQNKVRIALVGKYVQHADAYASVVKALYHAALCCNRSLVLEVRRLTVLCSFP